MTKEEYLLVCLGEEAAEIAQEVSKALRFGLLNVQPGQPDDHRRRIEREIGDLLAVVGELGLTIREADGLLKLKKLDKYMNLSRQLGRLDVSTGKE